MLMKVITDKFFDFGSNENGFYLRLGNGFQICWINHLSLEQNVESVKWNFPKEFINNDIAIIPIHNWNYESYGITATGDKTKVYVNILVRDSSNGISLARNASVVAIGKWK